MNLLKISAVAVVVLLFSFKAYAQYGELDYYSYYYDLKLLNPALAGIKDQHVITTVYAGLPNGTHASFADQNDYMVYGSYETSLPSIKSGIGGLIAYNESGPISTTQGAVFFNRKIPFNDNSGLRVGTRLSYRRTDINYNYYRYIHANDPLAQTGHEITNRFNVDLGVLYYSRIVNVGLSINDVVKEDAAQRVVNAIVTREFKVRNSLKMTPSIVFRRYSEWDWNTVDINNIFEIRGWVLLGAGCMLKEGQDDISFTAGLNVKDWAQVVTHVYSSFEYRAYNKHEPKVELLVRVNIPHHRIVKSSKDFF